MANNLDIKTGLAADAKVKTTDNAGVHTPHHIVDSAPLPTDAATATAQATGNTSLASIDGKLPALVTSRVPVVVGTELPAGTNNIGDVDVLSSALPTGAATSAEQTTQTAHLAAIEAAVESTDPVGVRLDSSAVMDGSTSLTPKFAAIASSTLGNNTLVAAVTSKKIRVLSAYFTVAGEVTTRFESGADGTALTGQNVWDAGGKGLVLPFNPAGWFETAAGALLNLELSAAVAVAGTLSYIEV